MDSVVQDLRYALRRLRSSPGLSAAVVATLAIGIGAAVATFSIVDAAVLRPLPFPDAGRLVRVREVTPEGSPFSFSEPDYLEFVERMRTVDGLAAMRPLQLTLTGAGDPTRLDGAAVTPSIFSLLGIQASNGRLFTHDDEVSGRPASVALISDALWRRRFGRDPSVVGRTVRLDGGPVQIVGVLPRSATLPTADIWVPLNASAKADRTDKWLDVVARTRPGVSSAIVQDEAQTVMRTIAAAHPEARGWSARVEPLADWLVGPGLRRMMWVLLAAVITLLALACANIAGLLMVRTPVRRFEMGIRGALGAARGRLVRQLITENALLAAAGCGLGLLAAAWMATALGALLADVLPPGRIPRIDGRAMAVAIGIAGASTLLFGLAPALHAAPESVERALRSGGRGTTPQQRRWSSALVSVQVALAMVLLAGSFVLLGSFARLSRVDPGFDASGVLTVPLMLPSPRYSEAARADFFDQLTTNLSSAPGVERAAATATNPFRESGYANDVTPEERAATAAASGFMHAGWRSVTPGFFATMKIPLVEGRAFTSADRDGGLPVAIVSRSLATRLWSGDPAVGHRLFWGGVDGQPRTIVGVVADVRDVRLDAPPQPTLYLPYAQLPLEGMTMVVRTSGSGTSAPEAIRQAIHRLDPTLPVDEIQPLEANRARSVSAPRFRTVLLAVFAGVALVLAAIGLYGVVAFTVAQRTREIAIRVALGASPRDVSSLFFRNGFVLALAGGAAGLCASWAVAGVLGTLLYQTSPRDAGAFALAAGVLIAVAVGASYLPARRAARLAPMDAFTRE